MTFELDRRALLAAGAALAATPACGQPAAPSSTDPSAPVLTKPIPSSGQQIPVVGIGTAQIFDFENDPAAFDERRQVLEILAAGQSGRIIDTAPSYGRAEARLGDLFEATGLRPRFFIAGKVASRNTPDGQKAELAESQRRMKTQTFELIQLHNVTSANQDFGLMREWKAQGVCKYIGMTTTSDNAYGPFEQVLAHEKPDFIEIDYAINNRNVEDRLLPMARDNGVAVLTALPFGRESVFRLTAGKPLPELAKEIGATTWAQFALKFLISHPAITAVIPGTDKPDYMRDNLGAGRGPMPDTAMRARMAAFIDGLTA